MAKREVNIKLNVDAKKAVKSTEDVNKGFKKVSYEQLLSLAGLFIK